MARDAEGEFVWVDQKKRGGVSLPKINAARLELRGRKGHLPFTEHTVGRRLVAIVDAGAWSQPRDQLDVIIDGTKRVSFRVRQVPSQPGDETFEFWETVRAADKDWSKRGLLAARDWVAAADHPGAKLAEGEAARMLTNAAYVLYTDARFNEATSVLDRALRAARSVGDDREVGGALYHKAQLAALAGAHVTATRLYTEAIQVAEARGEHAYLASYAARAALSLAALGRFGEALEVLGRHPPVDGMNERSRVINGANRSWVRLGAMRAGVLPSDVAAILTDHRNAEDALVEGGFRSEAANQYARIVVLEESMGAITATKALDAFEELEGDLAEHVRPWFELERARLETTVGRHDSAQRRLRLLGDPGRPRTLSRCRALELLAASEEAQGNVEEAMQGYADAVDCIADADRRLTVISAHAQFRYEHRGAAANLARLLAREGRPGDALIAIDGERAAVLEQHIVAIDVDRHLQEWASYQTSRKAEERARLRGCAAAAPGPALDECRAKLEAKSAAAEAALKVLQAAMPVRERKARDHAWLDRLRSALGDDHALLMVSGHGTEALYLFVFREGVRSSTSSEPLAAFDSRLKGIQHLYVVPDWHPQSYDPLGHRDGLSMSFLPHADVLLRPARRVAGGRVVIADPDGTLPASAREGEAVAAQSGATLLKNVDRTIFMRAWRSSSVLHYAGHAKGLFGDPWSVVLKLDDETTFTIFDVLTEPTSAQLVVLNGCATGPAARAGGGGFPAAMVHLGVESVLATTHSQRDGATSKFVHDFYEAGAIEAPAKAFDVAVRQSKKRGDDSWRVMRLWGRR